MKNGYSNKTFEVSWAAVLNPLKKLICSEKNLLRLWNLECVLLFFNSKWVWEGADGLCGTCPWHPGKRIPCCGSKETRLQTGRGWIQAELGDLQRCHLLHRTLGKVHEHITAQLPYGQNGRKVKPASKNFMRILDNACKAYSTVPDGKWQCCRLKLICYSLCAFTCLRIRGLLPQ